MARDPRVDPRPGDVLLTPWGHEVRVASADVDVRYLVGKAAAVTVSLPSWRLHAADWTVRRAEDSA